MANGLYVYNSEKELVRVAHHDINVMLTLRDIFPNDPALAQRILKRKPDAPKGKIRHFYGAHDNSSVCRKIIRESIKIILRGVVSGEGCFKFPGALNDEIYMGQLPDRLAQFKIQKGMYSQLDLLATNFKVPYISHRFSKKTRRQHLKIYCSHDEVFHTLIERANSGKGFSNLPIGLDHFLPQIYAKFSYINEYNIKQLLVFSLHHIAFHLRRGDEVRIVDSLGEIRFFRPLGVVHDKVMKKIVNMRKTRRNYPFNKVLK